MLKPKQPACQF